MKLFNNFYKAFSLFLLTIFALYLSGCVNVEQKTTIKEDGSGTINLHYWTKNSNLSMGDEVGGFGFTEDKAKANYTSSNTEVKDVKIEKNDQDSTTHVRMDITFKDFNKLNDAKGFSKIKSSWQKADDKYQFKYTLLQDTANAKGFGMSDYKLEYKFDFPNEVMNTNGNKEGKTVTWNKTVADLQNDVEMTAEVKAGGKTCGLFGLELPFVIFLGFTYMYSKRRRIKK